jgi:predicted ATPase
MARSSYQDQVPGMGGSARSTGPALLERDGELAAITDALGRACDGRGSFVVVEGPAGMGKTAVLKGSREIADARGMRVLRARGAELEREFAFGVVRQLFEPVLASIPGIERDDLVRGAVGSAARALGLPGAPSGTVDEPSPGGDWSFAVLHGLYWLCANLASGRPLYLVVDDAHKADAPSLRYLAFLLPRLEELPVALAVATRPNQTAGGSGLLEAITGDPSAEVIRLQPLSRDGVRDFVEGTLGDPPEPEFVDACLRATRGTPFMLHELAGALRDEGIEPTAESAPQVDRTGAHTIGRSVSLRLSPLSEPAVRLARSVAILERSELEQAARLAELTRDEAIEAADDLAAAGILDPGRPLRFVHPMVRTGIYEALSTGTRARGHRSAARLLGDVAGENERVAEHLLASEPAADPWTVDRLVEAARAAARRGAPETASVYLRRALAEPPEPDELAGVLLELGMAEASAGLADWRSHLEAAVEAATDDGASRCGDGAWPRTNRAQDGPPPSTCSIARPHRSIPPTESVVCFSRQRRPGSRSPPPSRRRVSAAGGGPRAIARTRTRTHLPSSWR